VIGHSPSESSINYVKPIPDRNHTSVEGVAESVDFRSSTSNTICKKKVRSLQEKVTPEHTDANFTKATKLNFRQASQNNRRNRANLGLCPMSFALEEELQFDSKD
jgi:hypothetical protein